VEGGDWPPAAKLRALTRKALGAAIATASLRYPAGAEVSLLFCDDARMRELNRQWRGFDKPTNVLSFPGEEIAPEEAAGPQIGDIALGFETLTREAELEGKPFEHHFQHLVIHGFLHLFGYDHLNEGDARRMEGLEREALATLGIDDPYADGE
jgi:probable rRNA maturation factor